MALRGKMDLNVRPKGGLESDTHLYLAGQEEEAGLAPEQRAPQVGGSCWRAWWIPQGCLSPATEALYSVAGEIRVGTGQQLPTWRHPESLARQCQKLLGRLVGLSNQNA